MPPNRLRFRRRAGTQVTAVRMALDTPGLNYRKWGHPQRGKAGDWLLDEAGEVYTVDAESFAASYRCVAPGRYEKTGRVWAVQASQPGQVRTKEGVTDYVAGDWLVCNTADGDDCYAIGADAFAQLYEPDD